jgi:3,4-dihydroxy 2-butanone 4-phosphate synthase / GTP cyclohydrolase II
MTQADALHAGSIEQAVQRFGDGEPVLVGSLDGSEATIALSARSLTAERLAAMHQLGGGIVVLGVDDSVAERLDVATVRAVTREAAGLRLALPVDARDCRDGGWSLADRVHTIRTAADPSTIPADLTVPGHVHAGIVESRSMTPPAAGLQLARMAGTPGAVVLRSLEERDGSSLSLALARTHHRLRSLAVAPIEELWSAIAAGEGVAGSISCRLPTRLGDFEIRAAVTDSSGDTIVTLVHGDPTTRERPLTRTHVACLLGDTFGSLLCDCRDRLERACEEIRADGAGVIIYVKPAASDPLSCPRSEPSP